MRKNLAAAGIPQFEKSGIVLILRWGIEPHYEDGEQRGVEFYDKEYNGVPALGELVDDMIRCQYSVSDELAILRQRDGKPEEFAAYNEFVEQCKTDARALLALVDPAPESEAEAAPAESESEAEDE